MRKESIRVNGNHQDGSYGENYFNKKTSYLFDLKYWVNIGKEDEFELAKKVIFGEPTDK